LDIENVNDFQWATHRICTSHFGAVQDVSTSVAHSRNMPNCDCYVDQSGDDKKYTFHLEEVEDFSTVVSQSIDKTKCNLSEKSVDFFFLLSFGEFWKVLLSVVNV
jgi:hypothetical protein